MKTTIQPFHFRRDTYGFMDDLYIMFDSLIRYEDKAGTYDYKALDGEIRIPAQYDYAYEAFTEGLAGVRINGKWGYVDRGGKTMISLEYRDAEAFSGDIAAFPPILFGLNRMEG